MANPFSIKKIDVIILAGGKGQRLKPLTRYTPKPMLKINKKPFLDILIGYIRNFGIRRFILCLGYKASVIKDYYQKKEDSLEILFSKEKTPLGTAGAIKKASGFIKSPHFLVLNGDSLCKVNLKRFLNFHIKKKASISMVVTKSKEENQYAVVRLDNSQKIIDFNEKSKPFKNSFISAGMYIFNKRALSSMPSGKYSLEKDFFPEIIKKAKVYGYRTSQTLIDIGTIKRYKEARKLLS